MAKRKFGLGRHTRLPEGVRETIEDLAEQELVSRVILGKTARVSNNRLRGTAKYSGDTSTGIKLKAYGAGTVTDLFVTVDPKEQRQQVIDYVAENYSK